MFNALDSLEVTCVSWPDWLSLSTIGSLASILGIVLSGYIFHTAKKINKYVLVTRRLPMLLAKLERHSSRVAELLNTFDQSAGEIRIELVRCQASLESLLKKLKRSERAPVRALIASIKKEKEGTPSKKAVYSIYTELLHRIEVMRELQRDFELES